MSKWSSFTHVIAVTLENNSITIDPANMVNKLSIFKNLYSSLNLKTCSNLTVQIIFPPSHTFQASFAEKNVF